MAAIRAFGTEELALNHLLEQSATNGNALATGPVADNVGSSSGAGGSGATNVTIPNDGDISGSADEIERDVEMEDELYEELQREDAFSDYDMELTRESEAIEEYLVLVLV